MENLNKVIAKNMQELRKMAGLTQADLAQQLNYSDKAVSKWERGESMPDVAILKQLADLYGVTVDYLLTEEHSEKIVDDVNEKIIRKNRFIISLLATLIVWLVATIVYAALGVAMDSLEKIWLAYVVAVPVSCIVLLVFNSIWGRTKLNFLIITILMWSTLVSLYLILNVKRLWLIFLIGIPAQVMIFLSSNLKKPKIKSKILNKKS